MDCSAAAQASQAASTLVCIVSPPDWRVYITPALVAVSVAIAFLAMRTTRSVARQRATLDLIEKRESTEHYRQTVSVFSRVRRSDAFEQLTNPVGEAAKADRQSVIDYLNHYELISIGILNNILDERIYRTWMRGPFTRDWNAAAGWIPARAMEARVGRKLGLLRARVRKLSEGGVALVPRNDPLEQAMGRPAAR